MSRNKIIAYENGYGIDKNGQFTFVFFEDNTFQSKPILKRSMKAKRELEATETKQNIQAETPLSDSKKKQKTRQKSTASARKDNEPKEILPPLKEVAELVCKEGRAELGFLMRTYRISSNSAQKILDELLEKEVVKAGKDGKLSVASSQKKSK